MPKQFRITTMNFPTDREISTIFKFSLRHPHRMEIYKDGIFQLPNNIYKNQLGELEFALPNDTFIPRLGENLINGENYFDREKQSLYIGALGTELGIESRRKM